MYYAMISCLLLPNGPKWPILGSTQLTFCSGVDVVERKFALCLQKMDANAD